MISFAKVTAEAYAGLTPVEDRIYYITDTGEMYLNGVKYGGGDQAQADWDQSDSTAVDFIKGKPTIPAAQVQSNWDESDSSSPAYIQNKPAISGGGGDADYLCFTAEQANSTVRLDKSGSPTAISIEYSTDRQTWTTYTWSGNTGTTITLSAVGDKVWLRGDNTTISSSTSNYYTFLMTGKIAACGDVTSLLDRTCLRNDVPAYGFYKLFNGCTSLTKTPDLPAMTLATSCYESMFENCSALTDVPAVLPATTVPANGYKAMFKLCTSLVKGSEINATSVGDAALNETFRECSALVQGPSILPATTLEIRCYNATFYYCTSLIKAPDLPATTVNASFCYNNLFQGCTSLRYAKIGATTVSSSSRTDMFTGISTTGVLVAPDTLSTSGWIPSNWTKVDASNEPDTETTSTAVASSGDTFAVCPGQSQTGVLTVASSLTLTALANASTDIAYAEVVIDLAVGATVTAGANLTLVDTPEAGKRNVCIVRWQGGSARLYVVDVMDIPA